MKFLRLTLCQEEVCTDDTDANDNDANDIGQSMIVQGSLVDKPNEPKNSSHLRFQFINVMIFNTLPLFFVKFPDFY